MDTRAKHLKRFRKRQRKENEKKEEEWRKEQERIKVEKEKTATLEANAKAVRNYLDSLHIEPQESGCFLLSDNFEDSVLLHILSFLDPKELVLLSSISRRLWKMSLSDQLWKPLAIQVWPELEMATQVDGWNLLYRRKSAEKATEYKHLMKEFSECDWYACPNGHVYLIGECRLPMTMAKCATCGAKIGGKSHMMLKSNEHLGAVDNFDLKDAGVELDDVRADKVRDKSQQMYVSVFEEEEI